MVRNRILSERGFLLLLAVLMSTAVSLALLDGIVRGLMGGPQLWETHVRYSWQVKQGERICIVAIRGKVAEPCSAFTKEEIATFRLQYETPSSEVLAGKF